MTSEPQAHPYPPAAAHADDVAPVPRRIRGVLGGRTVVDTTRATYVWEWSHYPQYYIPLDDVEPDVLVDESTEHRGRRGRIRVHGLRVGDQHRAGAAQVVVESPLDGVAGTVRFDWAALDHWYEEDEEVFVHPRNPYVRVDALRSTRHVQVRLGDTVLADSSSPVLLFETGLPTRYYLPRQDVRMDLLVPSDTTSQCPYKGVANYYSVRVGDTQAMDLVWYYRFPVPECPKIENLVCFFDEKVDSIEVDGHLVPKPDTPWAGKRVEKKVG